MRFILAILLPWVVFFTIRRPIQGVCCLLLQLTLIGWIPAAIWAVYSLGQYRTDRKIEDTMAGNTRADDKEGGGL
ncbi:YqaE/Pmp3 family membrane protein [Ruegeria atlantica]|uniref:YqaE/Pmp3 family membrane protein n=1 Tax=Ruegeria atlantica TaxID=81569 RepID=UPI00147F33EF|nr:YqaE/Pmp3 family membrane protein [Ruegeria atlantica]